MHHKSKQTTKNPINLISLLLKKIFYFSLLFVITLPGDNELAHAEMTEVERTALMEKHYTAAILSHDALIQGDIEMLRKQLSKIAKEKLPPSAPKSWKPHHARLIKATGNAGKISSMEMAASVMGSIAEACGSCHAALKARYMYYWPSPPDEEDKLKNAMRTHQWATERLWEGVTAPFKQAWDRGASALAHVQVFGEKNGTVEGNLRKLEADLREMGRKAQAANNLHE